MNSNIINFYLEATKLKDVIRSGWLEVEISKDRIESVAEHIYGCLILAIGLESEYNLNLDMLKVFKMLILKELEKVTLKEVTTREHQTTEDRKTKALDTIKKITQNLLKQDEILELIHECNQRESKESQFVYQLSKIESDIQAKIYDLQGNFKLDNAIEDAKHYGEELSKEIIPQIKNASDGWILYDRRYYKDEIFKDLSNEIQKL